jgi:hypothetical protein
MQSKILLKKDRFLIASFTMAPKISSTWVVFIPESGSDFRFGERAELSALVGAHAAKKFNFLIINKTGLTSESTDKIVYEKSFRRKRRIEDSVVTLKKMIPRGHKIHLIGYSEGAYLAPQIALLDARVCSVSMIGGGTRGWLKEELSNARPKEKSQYEKKIKEIHRNPSAKLKWNGFSYATWYSYRGDNTLGALRRLKIPMIAVLGARDRVIDLKSAIVDLVLVSERKPVQVSIFGDCGHYFTRHWVPVSRTLGRFLAEV